jgi:hypothetical protein
METFLLIEDVETIIFTTREIATGIVGDWNFFEQEEPERNLTKKIIKRFKVDSHDVQNLLFHSVIKLKYQNG